MSKSMTKDVAGPISIYVAGTMSGSEGRVSWGGDADVTCSCLPFEPKDIQFIRLIERNVSGAIFHYPSTEYPMFFAPSSQNAGVLHVSGSSKDFDASGEFLVEYIGPGKDSMGTIIDDSTVTGSSGWEENYAYLPLQGYESVGLMFSASVPDGGDVIRIRIDGTVDDHDTLASRYYTPVTLDFVKVNRNDTDELSGSVYVVSGTGNHDEAIILKSEPVFPLTTLRISYSSSVEEATSKLRVFSKRLY